LIGSQNYFGIGGLIIGLFFGIGLGQFLAETKENIKIYWRSENFKEQIAENGVICFLFLFIWTFIKSPFVTIYRLITGNFYFGPGY